MSSFLGTLALLLTPSAGYWQEDPILREYFGYQDSQRNELLDAYAKNLNAEKDRANKDALEWMRLRQARAEVEQIKRDMQEIAQENALDDAKYAKEVTREPILIEKLVENAYANHMEDQYSLQDQLLKSKRADRFQKEKRHHRVEPHPLGAEPKKDRVEPCPLGKPEEEPAPKRKTRRSKNTAYKKQEAERQRIAIQKAGEARLKAPTKSPKACEIDIASDLSTTDVSGSSDSSPEICSSDSNPVDVPHVQEKVAGEPKSYFGDCFRGPFRAIRGLCGSRRKQ